MHNVANSVSYQPNTTVAQTGVTDGGRLLVWIEANDGQTIAASTTARTCRVHGAFAANSEGAQSVSLVWNRDYRYGATHVATTKGKKNREGGREVRATLE